MLGVFLLSGWPAPGLTVWVRLSLEPVGQRGFLQNVSIRDVLEYWQPAKLGIKILQFFLVDQVVHDRI